MHATIQKSLEEILGYLAEGEKVFIVGCGNCATKCKSGGEEQSEEMKLRLENNGVAVTGWAVPPNGGSTCKLSAVRELLTIAHKEEVEEADSFLVLACGQGVHTVLDVVGDKLVHPGCDTIFGGETVTDDFITEYCSLCGECVIEYTGGLCPLTLCTKGLLNGPCGGAQNGKCEVDKERDCGWQLIYERLKTIGRLESLREYHEPKDYSKWSKPRSLSLKNAKPEFKSLAGIVSP
ncbi:TPA: 5,10-methylenetetrahydrofolate reductase [Candidatus Poribacteria bacterium]|nr:5,10-methylenetetrahydrofolate reductase [Candidatus Poribacteria bacterium]